MDYIKVEKKQLEILYDELNRTAQDIQFSLDTLDPNTWSILPDVLANCYYSIGRLKKILDKM